MEEWLYFRREPFTMRTILILFVLVCMSTITKANERPAVVVKVVRVYLDDTFRRYHLAKCVRLEQRHRSMTVEQATRCGYGACTECAPPVC